MFFNKRFPHAALLLVALVACLSGCSENPFKPNECVAPTAPSDVVATITSDSTIAVSWKDNSDNENYFNVFVVRDKVSWASKSFINGTSAVVDIPSYLRNLNREYELFVVAEGCGDTKSYSPTLKIRF